VTIGTARPERSATRPPVDIAFVIDRSGSMSGEPLELAKRGVIDALDGLAETDSFAVVAFDDRIQVVVPRASATENARKQARMALRGLEPGGSTNLFGGWEAGCMALGYDSNWDMSRGDAHQRRVRRTILLTDGHANVGLTEPGLISGHVAHQRGHGIGTSTLSLGTGTDEHLLESMAEAGGGSSAFVEHARDLPAFFARELGEELAVVATDAELTLTLPKGVRAELLNPFPVERAGKTLTVTLGDLSAGITLPLVFSVTTRVKAEGVLPVLTLSGKWQDVRPGATSTAPAQQTVPVDALMAVSPADFASMPLDDEASAAAPEMIAAQAKRTAIQHYRRGDRLAAQSSLSGAAMYAASAPMARETLVAEIRGMADLDPDSPDFELQRRQIMNDEHRRSRGRQL
jgi:Ca-activated chloride channel homolog